VSARARHRAGVRRAASRAGFTLMEMLVTLMLVSFTTMLMFQMLGSYRIANQRVQAQSGQIDRRALFQAWFRDSVNGLYADKDLAFDGSAIRFSGTTLNPLYASEGAPTVIEWQLARGDTQMEVVYLENGVERWRQSLEGSDDAHFAYVDADDKVQDGWPPKLGKRTPGELPALVMLVREGRSQAQPLAAAVLGPLLPPTRIYGYEQLQ
jgi:general secretion pathway protein J